MRIHEYQAKELFRRYGLPVPPSRLAVTVDDAVAAANALGFPVVVKAQIRAGGRGKGDGIAVAESETAAREAAGRLLGSALSTPQTGPEGRIVRAVLVEKGCAIVSESYVAIAIDRAKRCVVLLAGAAGGADVEETAASRPDALAREWVDPLIGLRPFQARRLVGRLGLPRPVVPAGTRFVLQLYRLFCAEDCSLVEVNPLAATDGGELVALDAKSDLDDNALSRHPEAEELRDLAEEDPLEARAAAAGLHYVKLDGNVGCLVNGAGLAMATMDLIEHAGARPANFLDVGGGASAETIEEGFRILIADPGVEAVFVNVFGGILRCDVLAEGVVAAGKAAGVDVPIVVRLEGTNVEAGREILGRSGLEFRMAADLREAARMLTDIAGGARP
jgi:succinyl-CoA synthetase beta subunit